MAVPRALLIMVSSLIQIEIGLLLSWNAPRGPLISLLEEGEGEAWTEAEERKPGCKGGNDGHKFRGIGRVRATLSP